MVLIYKKKKLLHFYIFNIYLLFFLNAPKKCIFFIIFFSRLPHFIKNYQSYNLWNVFSVLFCASLITQIPHKVVYT